MVCLKEDCCKTEVNGEGKFKKKPITVLSSGTHLIFLSLLSAVRETVRHASDCGGGTGIFLAVNSSTIVVIRGRRACIWGSIYLDMFGEEDKELKYVTRKLHICGQFAHSQHTS